MEPFVRLRGIAAPLPMINVDTDMIIPKQFLKTVKRTGLGAHLFEEMRFDRESGAEIPEFVLNRPPYREAGILLAGENFGCGSSREHAPWALRDFGIRCVIAPSFADIFHANCFKNGMLPVVLPKETVEALMRDARAAETAVLSVDLETREIRRTGNEHAPIPFEVDEFRRNCLLEGHDDISLTLIHAPEIGRFEEAHRANCPWM